MSDTVAELLSGVGNLLVVVVAAALEFVIAELDSPSPPLEIDSLLKFKLGRWIWLIDWCCGICASS